MTQPLIKVSAIKQATNHLRERIYAGEWKSLIPGERRLSEQLGVSRPTLRAALQILEQERLLSCEPNHSRRVLVKPKRHPSFSRRVTFLTAPHLDFQDASDAVHRATLTSMLHDQGIQTDQITYPSLECGSVNKTLGALVDRNRYHCWALIAVSKNVQKWFSDNRIPAIIIGSSFPDIQLPSIGVDNRAACRHAVGTLIKLGHRRISLVLPSQPRAGDIESQIGFTEGIEASSTSLVSQVIFTRRNPDDLRRKLSTAFASSSSPTGLVVCPSSFALTALTYCQTLGRKVPRDISIISRDSEAFMDFATPRISRYVYTESAFTKRLFSLLLKLASGSDLVVKKHMIVPKFEPANSIGPPPATG